MSAEETTQQPAGPAPDGADPDRSVGPVAANGERADVASMIGRLLEARRGLDYVAWCRNGQCQLESGPFDPQDRAAVRAAEGRDPGDDAAGIGARDACRRIVEKLSFDTDEKLDRRLSGLGTGRLIRTVLATDRGAVYCDQVIPGSYLAGVTIGLPADPEAGRELTYGADEAISSQVEAFRDRIHARRFDLGGWHSEQVRAELRAEPVRRAPSVEDTGELMLAGVQPVVTGAAVHPAVRAGREVVRARDLHLVALFDQDGMTFCVDVLHDPRLEKASTREQPPAPAVRRRWYIELGVELPDYLRELARTARGAIGGPLLRAVLDVENGAIYYRRINASLYLVGLTVFQPEVFSAERQIDALMDAWPA